MEGKGTPDLRRAPGRGADRRRRLVRRRGLLDRIVRRGGAPVVYGNRVEVFEKGRAAYEAMLDAIEAAAAGIAVEMYTWADDRVGRRFAERLRRQALRGIPVRILVDAFGSLGSEDLMASLEQAGAQVRWFHPLAPWAPSWYPNRRDHRKLVLVDGATGFVGGTNLAEEYTEEFRGERAWRDLTLRIEGPAAREMVRLFLGTWIRSGGRPEDAAGLFAVPQDAGGAGVQVVGGTGVLGRRGLRRSYLGMIGMARRRIFLANAYFAPEGPLRRALARAASRGVRVELLLPGDSDVPMVRWAGRACYGRLLDEGVRIREARGTFLHAKVAVFDDEVLLAGSANLDHRSFRHNLEIAVNVFEAAAAQTALATFEREFEAAREVTLEEWRRRPRSERLRERLARLVRYWL